MISDLLRSQTSSVRLNLIVVKALLYLEVHLIMEAKAILTDKYKNKQNRKYLSSPL